MKLGVIDYGAGNLRSVLNTFEAAGVHGHLVRTPEDAEGVTHLVLPGVGAFGDCAEKLRGQGLAPLIREWIEADRPFLGICVGYQVLFEKGEEDEGVPGLALFKGSVVRFPESELKVPHMGWNRLSLSHPADPVWKGMGEDLYFYFVHSYYPIPEDGSLVAASCTYGVRFAAAIRRGNLVATQFHPEKSQKLGVQLLKNFVSL
ncbi:MAG: imidazole glycerol phosphate synthase subunit HisH [Akkermansiaceae bacterium]|nr:imidazole glycerol phosphate synthase subunit HisH [Akkermansiaceae bacterium]